MTNDENESAPAVPEWNPLAKVEPVRRPLECSGGRASILCRPWSGRERLAYEDAITERLLTTDERDGTDTVKLGSLRLFAVSLTVVGSEGFGVEGFLAGTREERERDLLSITDSTTFEEIRRHALEVQPLPRAGDDDDEDGDKGTDEDGDPSPTPRTPETPSAGVDESASPDA